MTSARDNQYPSGLWYRMKGVACSLIISLPLGYGIHFILSQTLGFQENDKMIICLDMVVVFAITVLGLLKPDYFVKPISVIINFLESLNGLFK